MLKPAQKKTAEQRNSASTPAVCAAPAAAAHAADARTAMAPAELNSYTGAQERRADKAAPQAQNSRHPRTACQRTGDAGEDAAAAFLCRAGFSVLARNWRQGRLELDLVCRDKDTLVFVEVKTRAAGGMLLPAEAVDSRKRSALFRAARAWLAAHDSWHEACRFDVVCVTRRADTFTVEHIPDAFDISPFVDGGHAAWQPW